MMKWFERNFDFSFNADEADAICHRLRHTPARLQQHITIFSEDELNFKPDEKWSIKEHIGHLSLLERLWRERLVDFRERRPQLTPADLDNRATFEAAFNQFSITHLLDSFLKERTATLLLIHDLDLKDESITSLHPRLHKPMRIIDHLFFVAEHDDHHISAIRAFSDQQNSQFSGIRR